MTRAFRFKQFAVQHDRCAMKIGTDAILLGAWAEADQPKRILDIGTGSGVIALMLAQRFPTATVTAVEIDEDASRQAAANFCDSPFGDRLTVIRAPVQNLPIDGQSPRPFDLVVCNPPWFADSLKSPDSRRTLARHSDSLSLAELAAAAERLLGVGGRLGLVLPVEAADAFSELANGSGLCLVRRCLVRPTPQSSPKRHLLEFSNQKSAAEVSVQELVVETSRHVYSDGYITLAKDFLLKM